MIDPIDSTLENLTTLFQATDKALNEWESEGKEGNLQFPVLFGKVALNLNLDEKQLREADPFIRYYVRRHPNWHVTRGAHGGIMRKSTKDQKEAVRLAKEQARKQVEAAIAAKEAAQVAPEASIEA